MGSQSTQLIAISEAARMLGVSVYTIRQLVASGEVIAVNRGSRRFVRATEIDRLVQRGLGRARPTNTNRKER